MNRNITFLWPVVLAVIVLIVFLVSFQKQQGTSLPTHIEKSLIETILRTKELRCGYVTYAPYLQKNLQTSQLEGPIYDLVEELGKRLEVKIIWSEEADWNTVVQSLDAGRFDALCSLAWMDTRRAPYVLFSNPVLFNTLYAYTASENQKLSTLNDLNSPNIRLSVLDGSPDQRLAESRFSQAHIMSSASLGQASKTLLDIETGKADAAFSEPAVVENFQKHNQNSLRQLGGEPAQVFPLVMLLPKEDVTFKNFIDAGIADLSNTQAIQNIFRRYPEIESSILYVRPDY